MIGTLVIAFALLAQEASAAQTPADWRIELEDGKKAMSAREYAKAAGKFQSALAQTEAANAGNAAALEAVRGCATASRMLGRLEDAERFLARASALAAIVHGSASVELRTCFQSWRPCSVRAAGARRSSQPSRRR